MVVLGHFGQTPHVLSFAIGPIPGQFFNKILFLSSRPSYTFSTLKQHHWGPLKKPLLNPAAAQLFSYELQCKAAIAPPPIYVDWCMKRERESKKKKKIYFGVLINSTLISVLRCCSYFICYFCTLEYYWAWCTGLLIWDKYFFLVPILNTYLVIYYLLFWILFLVCILIYKHYLLVMNLLYHLLLPLNWYMFNRIWTNKCLKIFININKKYLIIN